MHIMDTFPVFYFSPIHSENRIHKTIKYVPDVANHSVCIYTDKHSRSMLTHPHTYTVYIYIDRQTKNQTDTMWIGYSSEKIQTSLFYICCFFISIV